MLGARFRQGRPHTSFEEGVCYAEDAVRTDISGVLAGRCLRVPKESVTLLYSFRCQVWMRDHLCITEAFGWRPSGVVVGEFKVLGCR